jgi:hypothetical protein
MSYMSAVVRQQSLHPLVRLYHHAVRMRRTVVSGQIDRYLITSCLVPLV